MSKTYQVGAKLLTIALLSAVSLSCRGNPSHSLPVKGTINIEVTPNGIICFSPNLNSATFADKPYYDLKGITDVYIGISIDWGADYKDEFSVISDKEKVCITENDFDFREKLYSRLGHERYYSLSIKGVTDDYKHRIHFTNEFYYP